MLYKRKDGSKKAYFCNDYFSLVWLINKYVIVQRRPNDAHDSLLNLWRRFFDMPPKMRGHSINCMGKKKGVGGHMTKGR